MEDDITRDDTETSPGSGSTTTTEPHTSDDELPLSAPEQEPTPPKKGRAGAVIAAALVGALAGGLVAFPVAVQVAEQRADEDASGRTVPLPLSEEREPPAPGSTAAIVEAIRPSVVAINTQTVGLDSFLEPVPSQGAGTGIVLDDQGHILTNNHVVQGANEIEVALSGGRSFNATVVGGDEVTDLAVLKIDADGLSPVPLGDSSALHVGDRVIAVGHALALPGGPTVTEGIVSALNRSIQVSSDITLEHLIQTDAAINLGNSGGPLLDAQGRVVGLNTAIAGGAQNIGFVIAITPAMEIVNTLLTEGEIVRPFLGVTMVDVTPEIAARQDLSVEEGALVVNVQVDSAADAAGLEPGDVIVEIEGEPVSGSEAVQESIGARKPGDRITIIIVRGEDRFRVAATLRER